MSTEECTGHDHCGAEPGENYWVEFWSSEEGKNCVLQEPHECLVKFQEKLLRGKSGIKIFVPLCGKTYDLMWLMERGHHVVGVEISEAAVKDFFQLNKLEYSETPVESIGGKLFLGKGGKIKIYNGDFFKFGPQLENDFEAVWDAGSIHSFGIKKRQAYVDVVKTVIRVDCQILIDDVVPCCSDALSTDQLQNLFGSGFTVEDLGFTKTESEFYKSWDTEGFQMYHVHK